VPWLEKVEEPFLPLPQLLRRPRAAHATPGFADAFLPTPIGGRNDLPEQTLALYDGEIRYADHCSVTSSRRSSAEPHDRTWIIVTADHGELFGEHDLKGHGSVPTRRSFTCRS
jgi:hypothetical protein